MGGGDWPTIITNIVLNKFRGMKSGLSSWWRRQELEILLLVNYPLAGAFMYTCGASLTPVNFLGERDPCPPVLRPLY